MWRSTFKVVEADCTQRVALLAFPGLPHFFGAKEITHAVEGKKRTRATATTN